MIKATMKSLLFILLFLCFTLISKADLPPDPGTGGPGTGDDPVGGGSPVGCGLIILISLGVSYSSYKIYKNWNTVVE